MKMKSFLQLICLLYPILWLGERWQLICLLYPILLVGGALGARQMHLTPQHGRKSVYHSVSFHNTTSFLVSQQTEFGFPVSDDVSFGSRQRLMDEGELEAAGLCCPLTVKLFVVCNTRDLIRRDREDRENHPPYLVPGDEPQPS